MEMFLSAKCEKLLHAKNVLYTAIVQLLLNTFCSQNITLHINPRIKSCQFYPNMSKMHEPQFVLLLFAIHHSGTYIDSKSWSS